MKNSHLLFLVIFLPIILWFVACDSTNPEDDNMVISSSCTDGIQNGNETGIDCGGDCDPCATCDDGIQNGTETGIDCGGTCVDCVLANCDGGPDCMTAKLDGAAWSALGITIEAKDDELFISGIRNESGVITGNGLTFPFDDNLVFPVTYNITDTTPTEATAARSVPDGHGEIISYYATSGTLTLESYDKITKELRGNYSFNGKGINVLGQIVYISVTDGEIDVVVD